MASGTQNVQELLPGLSPVEKAVEELSKASTDDRGAIFTRREVVDFILDLVEYWPTQKLQTMRLLEPSFGHGDFLIPAAERLMEALRNQKLKPTAELIKDSIRAVELHIESFEKTKTALKKILQNNGMTSAEADTVLESWLIQGDFLLTGFDMSFSHVVGNPPYIRQETVPKVLMSEYRRRYNTIYDRADIYIPFIEYSLTLLQWEGLLGFICADRWMKNRYGGPLRDMVAQDFHLRAYIDMISTPAFHSEVIAYPAITIIANEATGPTYVTQQPEIDSTSLSRLVDVLRGASEEKKVKMATVTDGSPWVLDDSESLKLIRRLESDYPKLEETGCKVGIGVATGADRVFIAPFEELDVEPDRKLPLIMTKDIRNGGVEWRGLGVINPFDAEGKIVSLEEYPKLRSYLESHAETIKKRHVAKKNPGAWYRTIDRIYPELALKPKLLVPDIKGDAHIVYEEGKLYPHHNLYHITSEEWDLQALRAVLLSGIARLFVATYSTRMHGNCLRFQAQYLRRIRVLHWNTVPAYIQRALKRAAEKEDFTACNDAVSALYGLSEEENAIIRGDGN